MLMFEEKWSESRRRNRLNSPGGDRLQIGIGNKMTYFKTAIFDDLEDIKILK